ncbi:MAG: biotin carboxyl carrier domain-containing protein [Rhodobacteraceae bacterium]|jgi:biotin carboxyl carrier protein|nr:biotin carboxyl carrier domain-containing protein [Paracoccaceae bacterium]
MPAHIIRAELPGIFYHRPGPDRPPFKADGEAVAAGDVVGLIEVMKSFNEVRAERGGIFAGYMTDNDGLVDVDDPLAAIET